MVFNKCYFFLNISAESACIPNQSRKYLIFSDYCSGICLYSKPIQGGYLIFFGQFQCSLPVIPADPDSGSPPSHSVVHSDYIHSCGSYVPHPPPHPPASIKYTENTRRSSSAGVMLGQCRRHYTSTGLTSRVC